MNISEQRHHPPTHLFTVRLWLEAWGEGQGELRMQVKHVLSGETRYFRDWGLLSTYLQTKMQEVERASGPKEDDSP
jgi:hypothetical protein